MMQNDTFKESSSFRDNFGSVYHSNGDILRTVNKIAEKNFNDLKEKNIFKNSIIQITQKKILKKNCQ